MIVTAPRDPGVITDDLTVLGVRPGDVVMVHVSLRAVGPVVGGAGGLIDALDRAVGAAGTILVNVGARNDWSWVDGHPEAERPGLLAGSEPFDPSSTPADPDNGVFAEVFRTTPGAAVSDHPEGRFAARGHQAVELTEAVPWDHYYGPGSPLARFVARGGRVLRLGADIDTVTVLHLAEYLVDLPDKRAVRRYRLVASADGPVVRTVDCLDDSDGIASFDVEDDEFGVMLTDYLATGAASVGTVGTARAELIDAADLVAFGQRWMRAHVVPR